MDDLDLYSNIGHVAMACTYLICGESGSCAMTTYVLFTVLYYPLLILGRRVSMVDAHGNRLLDVLVSPVDDIAARGAVYPEFLTHIMECGALVKFLTSVIINEP